VVWVWDERMMLGGRGRGEAHTPPLTRHSGKVGPGEDGSSGGPCANFLGTKMARPGRGKVISLLCSLTA